MTWIAPVISTAVTGSCLIQIPHSDHTHLLTHSHSLHSPSYDALVARFPEDFRGYLAKGVYLRDKGRRADAERMFLQVRRGVGGWWALGMAGRGAEYGGLRGWDAGRW
jgi:hypothetical protein